MLLGRVVLGAALLAIVLSLFGGVAPSTSSAFIGENFVKEGAKLTKDAENLIKVPDFIPEVWKGGGGPPPPAQDSAAWTDFFEAGGSMPILGSVAAFGIGTGIGSVICNEILELEGCWYYGSKSADPSVTGGNWVFKEKPLCSGVSPFTCGPSYTWYWNPESTPGFAIYQELGGVPAKCSGGLVPPASRSGAVIGGKEVKLVFCSGSGTFDASRSAPIRYSNANREMDGLTKGESSGKTKYTGKGYCPLAGPGTLECSTKPPSNWSEREATCLTTPATCGITEKQRDEIGEHIAAETPEGKKAGLHDPLHAYAKVPSCTSTWLACKTSIEELELVPERDSLDWKTAHLELGAAAVITLSPSTGSEVKVGSKVLVETNPDSEGMPAVIPDPEEHETYSHYIARLAPSLDPTREIVSDANEDASAGPDAVLQVTPEPGTRSDPAVTTAVEVQTNPHDAPAVPIGGGSCDASVGSLDLSPLNQPVGEKFPFGVIPFFIDWIGEWSSTGVPEWSVTIVPKGVFGSNGIVVPIDLHFFDSWAGPIRIAFIFASFAGLLWFLGTAFLNLRGDNS